MRSVAAEKDPYASLRSIASLQRTKDWNNGVMEYWNDAFPLVHIPSGSRWGACPERSRRIDFSRASPLDLFEQPAPISLGIFKARRKAATWCKSEE